jgi:cytochrome c oxidase cbb3-type subunit I/II
MVRPFRDEVVRYGEYSKAGEYIYDRPFLWGSKRTGPDLHREGGKNPDSWHFTHMLDPRETSPGSIMPRYPWLVYSKLDVSKTKDKLDLMKNWFNIPYEQNDIDNYKASMEAQAKQIVTSIFNDRPDYKAGFDASAKAEGDSFVPLEQREIVALIAYLQRLGTDIKKTQVQTASN